MRFTDRTEAGAKLATALDTYRHRDDVVIFALPRGGVIVGRAIARALDLPLDLVITRKIGHPDNPEYAVCAITEAGGLICNEPERALLDPTWLAQAAAREQTEAIRRRQTYLPGRHTRSARGKIAIIVDDGVATGLTLRAAIRALRADKPKQIIVAVPVAPADTARVLRHEADELVVLIEDDHYLGTVGAYYDDFSEVSDAEVIALLQHE